MRPLIKRLIDAFIYSDYFANYQSESIQSSSYSGRSDRRDRFDRCYTAAADGAEGSTHAEVIQDMREAFHVWLKYERRSHWKTEFPYRIESVVQDYFDNLEEWHRKNDSLEQEVG